MVRNFEINESDQHALTYIESAEVFLSPVHILFSQKMIDFKTRGENAAILIFFTNLIQNKCLTYAPTNTLCGLVTIG